MGVWENAGSVKLQVNPEIPGGFDVGFDKAVPEEIRDTLIKFAYWVEDHYPMPVTLWVDFKYRHYLMNREKKRTGYLFYWADFQNYPVFEDPDDIPVICLPVRTERQTEKEILRSFAEGISNYFAWLSGADMKAFVPEDAEVERILKAYLENINQNH